MYRKMTSNWPQTQTLLHSPVLHDNSSRNYTTRANEIKKITPKRLITKNRLPIQQEILNLAIFPVFYFQPVSSQQLDEWKFVMATFKKHQGLSLYYNSLLQSNDATGNHVPNTYLVNANKNLAIGRNIHGPPYHYAAFHMSSLVVFQEYLYRDDVRRAYVFYWGWRKFSPNILRFLLKKLICFHRRFLIT